MTADNLSASRRHSPLLLRNQPRITKYLLILFFSIFLLVATLFLWTTLQTSNGNLLLADKSYWPRFVGYSDEDQANLYERIQSELETETAAEDNEDTSYAEEQELLGVPSSDGEDLLMYDDTLELDPNTYEEAVDTDIPEYHGERFVAYLPHSGLSNQLGELENALVIAHMMNRTLVLPPVYLGCAPEMSWKHFHMLRRIVLRVDEKVGQVTLDPKKLNPDIENRVQTRLRFHARKAKTILEWSDLIDLEPLKKLGIRFAYASELVANNIVRTRRNITTFEENRKYEFMYADFVPLKGNPSKAVDNRDNRFKGVLGHDYVREKPFRYMVYKSPNEVSQIETSDDALPLKEEKLGIVRIPLEKYFHVVQLKARIPEFHRPLLLLGSVFGHMRLSLHSVETIAVRQEIRQHLAYTNPVLKSLTDRLVDYICSKTGERFIGIHVRIGDGNFAKRANGTIRNIASTLSSKLTSLNMDAVTLYIATDASPTLFASEMFDPFRIIPAVHKIVTMDELLSTPSISIRASLELFVSPDRPPTGLVSTLAPILSLFDHDLESAEEPVPFEHTYASEEVDAKKWTLAIPILDQMIASRGHYILGTKASTFSKMIERLHELYCDENGLQNGLWGKY